MKDYLNDLYARLGGQMKLGLDRTFDFMKWLDNPESAFPSIHVAGTNGKGSVVAVAEAILRASGLKTGRFTSPHLLHFNERIRINGDPVPEEEIETLINLWRPWLDSHEISFFEITTGLAFYLFRKHHADAAIIETGLGGRLDSTNVITPRTTVITSVNKDHVKILGDTLKSIAEEKAGIIKAGIPVLTGPQKPAVIKVLKEKAKQKNAPLTIVKPEDYFTDFKILGSGMNVQLKKSGEWIHTPLAGVHQLENLALALKSCELFLDREPDLIAVKRGLSEVSWPGRFEKLSSKPLIYYDVAHNPSGVERLKELVMSLYPQKKKFLIIGMLGDKETRDIVEIMLPDSFAAYLAPVASHRSMSIQDLTLLASSLSHTSVMPSVSEAVKRAMSEANDDDLILIYGSHYMAGEVYAAVTGAEYTKSEY